jgi:exopolyphosphatase/guanosine-5'-triphosphate,3'-diphosphate pyrophosphatase
MLFGAIDVGTNSIHLVVVELDAAFDTSRVVHKSREMVRLGSDDALERGRLSRKAMERGVDAIGRMAEAARLRGAERLRAVATSAVRESVNGEEFARLVRARSGLDLEILSGDDEARLIHLGVANGFPIYDRIACIIDIGGGSTEIVVADGERPYHVDSVHLGSLRLYDAYLRNAKDAKTAARGLDTHIDEVLAPVAEVVRSYEVDLAIGTSGTIMGLASIDAAMRGLSVRSVHGYTLTRARLEAMQKEMIGMSEADRRRMPGMNPRRADIIVAGNAVLIGALRALGRDEITVCERALRDGVVVDFVRRDRALAEKLGDARGTRLAAIESLAGHYEQLGGHQRHVARLALTLFERLAPLHGLPPGDRDLLWAGATLHSVGRFIARSGRHKHASYIIRNSLLTGWREDEREVVAQIVRYGRRTGPKPSHTEYAALQPNDRRRVDVLTGMLRIADGLDARALGQVSEIDVTTTSGRVTIRAISQGDISTEIETAAAHADVLERTLGITIDVQAAAPPQEAITA